VCIMGHASIRSLPSKGSQRGVTGSHNVWLLGFLLGSVSRKVNISCEQMGEKLVSSNAKVEARNNQTGLIQHILSQGY